MFIISMTTMLTLLTLLSALTTSSSMVSSQSTPAAEAGDSRDLIIIETQTSFHEESKFVDITIHVNPEDESKTCITEIGLDLKHLVMAQTAKFKEETFEECARFCMNNNPNYTHVLINYYNAVFVGDQFNCMCANKEAIANAQSVPEGQCRYQCPKSNYRCGDARKNLLSVYCIHRSCHPNAETPVCSKRLPHDIHGCFKGDLLNWEHAHNVRNFSSGVNQDSACIWECKDNHPRSMYALTRVTGQVLTCSCGYGRVLDPDSMVDPEFCGMLDTAVSNYYDVNCVTDLDANGGPITNSSERCDDVTAVGCIFEDLVLSSNPRQFSIKFDNSEKTDPTKDVDVMKCVQGCAALYPTTSYFAGVRWDGTDQTLNCWCLTSEAFNASSLGPSVTCNTNCGPKNSGLHCGAQGDQEHHRALSLYCIPDEELEKRSSQIQMPEMTRSLSKRDVSLNQQGGGLMDDYLSKIEQALRYSNITTEVVIGLLVLIVIAFLCAVLYLWEARGISSLSRQVM